MKNLGVGANGLVEVNSHMKDEGRDVRNGVSGEGQRLSEENEPRINEDAADVNNRCVFQAQPVPQRQQQQLPGPVIRWERFLPMRSLCVLLVENDDSTRHVVSALLRNCSYEVTAVAHGLEAWKALEDPTIHIDLVLTEVVMPYLSGLDLLSKILSHKTYKSIPLIMMSSNDSMGIVFKCLSKGAVDFLVKPIRKNELKHLWQHVWRKCHTSSFSGSESGIRIQKPPSGSRNIDKAGIKNGSSGEDDNWSTDFNVNDGDDDGSDNGSDNQSSWSKRVEVDRTQPFIRWSQSGDSPDSTCALVTNSRSEPATDSSVPRTATRERNEEADELVAMGKYLEIRVPINQELQVEEPNRKMQKTGVGRDKFFDTESKRDSGKSEKRVAKLHSEAVNGELRKESSDSMVVITNSTDPRVESATNEDDQCKNTIEDKTTDKTKKPPSLELDLNSLREGDTRTRTNDSERNVLRHSDLSAFSRYNTTLNVNQAPTRIVGSCSPPENSSRLNLESNTDGSHNQCSNGSSNNDDMGSTTNVFSKPAASTDKKLPDTSTNAHLCSAFQPVKNSNDSSILPEIQGNNVPPTVQPKTTQQQVQVQHRHHYHHYHHHHHHVHNMQQAQHLSDHDNLPMRNTSASASHLGLSNDPTLSIEGNAANYSLNASGSGSNNRSNAENCSNGPNENNIVATAGGINVSSDNGGSLKCGADDGNGSGSRNGVDQNRLARREAALLKFRQKRKDRCFEKKVRYQSRQKLAEQRPRVKGQFVRQVVNKDKNEYPNS